MASKTELKGLVRKGVGGFYYVENGDELVFCKARGRFRKEHISPVAGDMVSYVIEDNGEGALKEILPRRNFFIRPPLANLDRLFVVSSTVEPFPDFLVIDKTIAAAELKGIEPVVVFTKTDLQDASELKAIYDLADIRCVVVSSSTGQGVDEVRELLGGGISAFTGNSGVGKSSLLNAIFPELGLKTGEISRKLGRGRHTTREVELYPVGSGGYVADTPGFSTFDIGRYELSDKEALPRAFREFGPYLGECRFSSCSHTCEKGCSVIKAVDEGKIARSRFESYRAMYEEIKDVRQWQLKNKGV